MSSATSTSLSKLLLSLATWYLPTLFLAQGVEDFYGGRPLLYYTMPLAPAAVYFSAKHFPRWSMPLCYGLICGWTFGFPSLAPRALRFGAPSLEWMVSQILFFTAITLAMCFVAFGYRLRQLGSNSRSEEAATRDAGARSEASCAMESR
jgi:hypothetical protein